MCVLWFYKCFFLIIYKREQREKHVKRWTFLNPRYTTRFTKMLLSFSDIYMFDIHILTSYFWFVIVVTIVFVDYWVILDFVIGYVGLRNYCLRDWRLEMSVLRIYGPESIGFELEFYSKLLLVIRVVGNILCYLVIVVYMIINNIFLYQLVGNQYVDQ